MLGWKPVHMSWLNTLPSSLTDKHKALISSLYCRLVPPCLDFVRKAGFKVCIWAGGWLCVCVCMYVCACVGACVGAYMHLCMCMFVHTMTSIEVVKCACVLTFDSCRSSLPLRT